MAAGRIFEVDYPRDLRSDPDVLHEIGYPDQLIQCRVAAAFLTRHAHL